MNYYKYAAFSKAKRYLVKIYLWLLSYKNQNNEKPSDNEVLNQLITARFIIVELENVNHDHHGKLFVVEAKLDRQNPYEICSRCRKISEIISNFIRDTQWVVDKIDS